MLTVSKKHVSVVSIGKARPRTAVAVAHGLGLPIEKTLTAIYRAPSLLVSDVDAHLADKLTSLLEQVGLETEVSDKPPVFEEKPLFDIALRLTNPASAHDVADALASFCACDTERALNMMITPPGVVLGRVSKPTADALQAALPDDAAELIASDIKEARYVLIHNGESRTVLGRLERAVAELGYQPLGAGVLMADDLGFADAEALWGTFGRTGSIRIVNRDFLHFEIWLEGRRAGPEDPERVAAMHTLAGIPENTAERLLDHSPFVLESDVRHHGLEDRMSAYTAAGLQVRAELTTFQAVSLDIVGASEPERLDAALRALSLPVGTLPVRTPAMMETQARITRATLEAVGAEVYFAELQHG